MAEACGIPHHLLGCKCLEDADYIEVSKAEIVGLRKDRERLDWLITNEAYVASDRDREVFHIRWEFDCNDEESSSGVNQIGHFDSPREALDAAMAEGKVAE